jgi:TPR repeat protein
MSPGLFPAANQRATVRRAYSGGGKTAQAAKPKSDGLLSAIRVNHLLTMIAQVLRGASGYREPICPGVQQMATAWFNNANLAGTPAESTASADLVVARCLTAAAAGDASAYFDLGVAFSTGSHGVAGDLIEAHKWFNLAAVSGHAEAQMCRADIADEMTAREIAEAQRRAREWIAANSRRAA